MRIAENATYLVTLGFGTLWQLLGPKSVDSNNSTASAEVLVEEILDGGQEFMPKIQQEVVHFGKKLCDTEAGAYLNEALQKQREQQEQEKEALRDEYKRAERACK